MTSELVQLVESQFNAEKQKATDEQWNRAAYIRDCAFSYENSNVPLALRLMQRAHNLHPDGPLIKKKLNEYAKKIEGSAPEALISSSDETGIAEMTQVSTVPARQPAVKTSSGPVPGEEKSRSGVFSSLAKLVWSPFVGCVVLPSLLLLLYLTFIAAPRFESRSQLIVQQPDGMSTMDSSMAILTGLGVSSSSVPDNELVKVYIYSSDMLNYLQDKLDIRSHYQSDEHDFFSRLKADATEEMLLEYYSDHIDVKIDSASSVIVVTTQGFSAEFANALNKAIVQRAEWYINSIGHQLANAQLKFIEGEYELVAIKLQTAKEELLRFQQTYNLLDPSAEGSALQQIAYGLEGQIVAKQSALRTLQSVMSDEAPQVVALKNELAALNFQLAREKQRLIKGDGVDSGTSLSINEVLAKYTDFKTNLELAQSSYTSSLVSLEKSRIEAYRQLKYLIVVESSTMPEDNRYPDVGYSTLLLAFLLCMVFGIGRIVIATVKELS